MSLLAITTLTYILLIILCRTCKGIFNFLWNSDKTFLIAFLYKIFKQKELIWMIISEFYWQGPVLEYFGAVAIASVRC